MNAAAGADRLHRTLIVGIALTGAAWLALAAWVFAMRTPYPFHGHEIYDIYYAAILDGRLDLPPRTLRFEGHYAADGTAFLYHGMAPLLTRFAFGWFWPFDTLSMSGPSVWFWTVIGTAGYQSGLIGLIRRADLWITHRKVVLLICAGLWLVGPGLLLIANQSFYHEPIAVAFGAAGLFVAAWVRMARGRMSLGPAVLLLALLAVVAFHARPNVALGFYVAVTLAVGWGLWQYRTKFLAPGLLSGLLLGAGVAGFLALNEARFGSATQFDGSFTQSERVYGAVFWGFESPDSERALASREHGRFNVLRVIPNLVLYAIDLPPRGDMKPVSNVIADAYSRVTEPILGLIRIERPRAGVIFLWPLWVYLSAMGLTSLRRDPAMAALVFGVTLSTGLTLAYATVTLRYRIDIWPIFGVLAGLGVVSILKNSQSRLHGWAVVLLLCIGLTASLYTGYRYARHLEDTPDSTFFTPWSYDDCIGRATDIGFTGADLARICRAPSMDGA